jgi:dTDP-4-dehydrorhamnose 3,5-epimerase-like enzyme
MHTIDDCSIINLPKILDDRGNLSVIEYARQIPFSIKRAYWIYDVPGGEMRGGHAYKTLHELIVSLSGSFDVVLDDGSRTKVVSLNRSYYGLLVPNMIWRHLENFSTNAVCLVLASQHYSEADYLRDYHQFKHTVHEVPGCPR